MAGCLFRGLSGQCGPISWSHAVLMLILGVAITSLNRTQAFHRASLHGTATPEDHRMLQAQYLSSIGARETVARAHRGAAFQKLLGKDRARPHSLIQEVAEEKNNSNREVGSIPRFSALPESEWDYNQHGKDWGGMCAKGMQQSPVDLHIEGLQEPEYRNLTNLYMNAFSGTMVQSRPFKPWKRGDFFYTYPHQFTQVDVYKSSKVFQVRIPEDQMTPLGAMFSTDTAEMYTAQHIFFHSPSEHTFQGEANRREIEMQIWHYSNDLLSFESSTSLNHTSLPFLALFAQSSLNLPDVEEALRRDQSSGADPNLPSSHWRVISLTFMSEELDQTSLAELKSLPSERLLSTLLSAERINSEAGQSEKVQLVHPLNLQSVMMMLQLTNTEFFAYDGSTTMPDCTENVRWYVARQPLPVATETMLRFYKMLNPQQLKSREEKDGNFRMLQNVEDNMRNEGNVFLVQGFPLQVLVANSLGFDTMAKMSKEGSEMFQGWFTAAGAQTFGYSGTALAYVTACLVLLNAVGL
ncbi:putative duplicated carbonic anhydrase [Neospora caninum Liverpool]|uniref:Duplicated carbonic anhydrase, putative n=1 Tax=Neospora caninum (strain Liverpool) TaxID=572307 RepID=F0V8V1_NEOCL|nr:putative duplicated carbonic anhydrase [Neospora caninum Liverpool]CBZ50142.1 putative duplicated carbonic anhydrase [Neospora caninum Liverpool]CEL64737.1 TPA: duplicated carbonic anhydrase, putative [Neospora caninum Liverpool]|eukprot:XP_003880177.1 putative duplicated carbonic anhydrase [Neospora caninum Liverpool]